MLVCVDIHTPLYALGVHLTRCDTPLLVVPLKLNQVIGLDQLIGPHCIVCGVIQLSYAYQSSHAVDWSLSLHLQPFLVCGMPAWKAATSLFSRYDKWLQWLLLQASRLHKIVTAQHDSH